MEIVKQIRDAIQYMDDHLLEDITFQDVAKAVYMSNFNFHRTFKILTDITPTEYIRNRRLSLAGEDITHTDSSILDIAMKYQYETLEGFSKAFRRFHRVSPSRAKQGNVLLKTYHPLKINISFEGGKSMDYKIVTLEPFTILSKNKRYNIETVNTTEETTIGNFWKEQSKEGLLEKLFGFANEPGLYGICYQHNTDSSDFDYGIGVKVNHGTEVEGLSVKYVDNPLWVVFECTSVDHIGEVWDTFTKHFLVDSGYERVEELDFEFYPENREDIFCELYIPIRKSE